MAQIKGAEEMESRECTDALSDEGFVLELANTGKVNKAAANAGVYGIAYASTKDPVTGTALANKQVTIVKAPKIAYVQYQNAGGETIAINDLVSTKGANAAGTVKKHAWTTWAAATGTERKMIVGIALEAKGASTSGKLKCQLLCPSFPMQ